jgi:hypothetical protein
MSKKGLSLWGKNMSMRNVFALVLAVSGSVFLAACGSNSSTPRPVCPPSGCFSASNLNGTYVFTVSGSDFNTGAAYSIVGTINANGSGGITGGTIDVNDAQIGFAPGLSVNNNGTYSVGQDGRGNITISTSQTNPFENSLTFDFVLANNQQGLITEFDSNGTGSGTLDLQSAGTSLNGSYAFLFSGGNSGLEALAAAGNFGLTGSGFQDLNSGGLDSSGAISATVVLGPSSSPGTTLGGRIYDVYAINADHLKFIEMDSNGTLSGDAFSQPSTSMPVGTLAFTLEGLLGVGSSAVPAASGGFMVMQSGGAIANTSTEDINDDSAVSSSSFSGTYTPAGTGRYTLGSFSGFAGGTSYAAYPSSGGLLLLEIDDAGIMAGSASNPQTSTSLAGSTGYGLNLTGENLSAGIEVDDIAEFVTSTNNCTDFSGTAVSGTTITGLIDENSDEGSVQGTVLCGTYSAPDANGRGQITVGSVNTLNTGLGLTFYTVDGTMFPFIETDTGQVSAGVFLPQSATGTPAIAKAHNMYIPRASFRPRTASQKRKLTQ